MTKAANKPLLKSSINPIARTAHNNQVARVIKNYFPFGHLQLIETALRVHPVAEMFQFNRQAGLSVQIDSGTDSDFSITLSCVCRLNTNFDRPLVEGVPLSR